MTITGQSISWDDSINEIRCSYNIHQPSRLMIYSQRHRVRNVINLKPYLYQNYPDFYFRFSLVKVSSLKRMSTNVSEERNRCAIRELKP
jgi:hypothetical protein